MTKKQKQKIYKSIQERLVPALNPRAIYIFGSFARDEERKYSDIDVLIEQETPLSMPKRATAAYKYLRGMQIPFDILVYTPRELCERVKDKYSVAHEAVCGGIKIYEKHV